MAEAQFRVTVGGSDVESPRVAAAGEIDLATSASSRTSWPRLPPDPPPR